MSRSSQRGTALVEFAIVSTAALTIMLGILDFARALYSFHLVSEVARQGARHAIVSGVASCAGGSPDPLQSWVSSQAPLVGSGSLTVTTTCSNSVACADASSTNCSNANNCTATSAPYDSQGCIVSVEVDYPFHFLVPLVSNVTLQLTSTSTMVISQ
ncbi:MAG: TadE/TadG family type IV pilus assembly protein [Vulcanimicrobiaceae bacterium]